MDLLCDYTDSSSSEDEEVPEEEEEPAPKPKVWLPPPDLATASMKADDEKDVIYRSRDSVFRSQYEREKEEAQAVLEQHVVMSDNQAKLFEREKDGKKICWNFRKGRCYKGHNCPLFHDGDLKKVKADESSRTQIRMANRGPSDRDLAQMEAHDKEQKDDGDPSSKVQRKRRYGLTDSLAPAKGAMRNLETIDAQKNPHRYQAPSLPKNAKFHEFRK